MNDGGRPRSLRWSKLLAVGTVAVAGLIVFVPTPRIATQHLWARATDGALDPYDNEVYEGQEEILRVIRSRMRAMKVPGIVLQSSNVDQCYFDSGDYFPTQLTLHWRVSSSGSIIDVSGDLIDAIRTSVAGDYAVKFETAPEEFGGVRKKLVIDADEWSAIGTLQDLPMIDHSGRQSDGLFLEIRIDGRDPCRYR